MELYLSAHVEKSYMDPQSYGHGHADDCLMTQQLVRLLDHASCDNLRAFAFLRGCNHCPSAIYPFQSAQHHLKLAWLSMGLCSWILSLPSCEPFITMSQFRAPFQINSEFTLYIWIVFQNFHFKYQLISFDSFKDLYFHYFYLFEWF